MMAKHALENGEYRRPVDPQRKQPSPLPSLPGAYSAAQHPIAGARGFTMIELLVTMVLLSIVLTGLTALQLTAIRSVSGAKRANEATRLAQGQIERFNSMSFAVLTGFAHNTWTVATNSKAAPNNNMQNVAVNGFDAGPYTVSYYLEDPGTVPPRRLVTVRVTWLDITSGNEADPTKKYRTLSVVMTTQRTQ